MRAKIQCETKTKRHEENGPCGISAPSNPLPASGNRIRTFAAHNVSEAIHTFPKIVRRRSQLSANTKYAPKYRIDTLANASCFASGPSNCTPLSIKDTG